jgi:hypothetical protein
MVPDAPLTGARSDLETLGHLLGGGSWKVSIALRQFGQQNDSPARVRIVERSTIATPHSTQVGASFGGSALPRSIAAAQLGQQNVLSPRTTWVVGSEIGI